MTGPYPAPSRRERLVAHATGFLGGPAGRFLAVGRRGLLGVVQVLVLLAGVMIALGVVQKGHCVLHGWSNPDQFWRACYSDLPVHHVTTVLSERALPVLEGNGWDVPLLSALTMWGVALVTPVAGVGVAAQQWVFGLWAVLALVLLASAVLALVSMLPRRPWQVAHLAASPVLIPLALLSVDLLGVALVCWGWWAWRRSHPLLAGVLLGAAGMVRPLAWVFLIAILLVAGRAGRSKAGLAAATSAAITVAVVLLPFLLVHPEGAVAPLRSWWLSMPSYGGPTLIPQLIGLPLGATAASVIAAVGWVLAFGLGYWLSRHAARVPSVTRLTAPMLLVVVLTSTSVSAQTGIWLLPLLAVSAVSWRDHLIWAGAEIVHFVAVWMHIGYYSDAARGLPPESYALFILLRMAAWAYVVWRVWSVPFRSGTAVDRPDSGWRAHQARSSSAAASSPIGP